MAINNVADLLVATLEQAGVHPLLARLYAARGVASGDELDDALEELYDSKVPYVLNVLVPYQEHVLPMIPGGMTVRDMIKA